MKTIPDDIHFYPIFIGSGENGLHYQEFRNEDFRITLINIIDPEESPTPIQIFPCDYLPGQEFTSFEVLKSAIHNQINNGY